MLREHDVVALTAERVQNNLRVGDVGAIVHCFADGKTFEVEFLDEQGRTKSVATDGDEELMRLNLMSLAG